MQLVFMTSSALTGKEKTHDIKQARDDLYNMKTSISKGKESVKMSIPNKSTFDGKSPIKSK